MFYKIVGRLSKLYHRLAIIYILGKNLIYAPYVKSKVKQQQTNFKRKNFQIVSVQNYVLKRIINQKQNDFQMVCQLNLGTRT